MSGRILGTEYGEQVDEYGFINTEDFDFALDTTLQEQWEGFPVEYSEQVNVYQPGHPSRNIQPNYYQDQFQESTRSFRLPANNMESQASDWPPANHVYSGLGQAIAREHQHSKGYSETSSFSPLISTSRLQDQFRTIFPFGAFNAIQSACFDKITGYNENIVVSAPTGGGKTVLFELGIIRLLREGDGKCIYMAPTKALCSEKFRDWSKKFSPLGYQCCELTGDTVLYGKGAWADARKSRIIVTTPEKLDSLSRSWHDHEEMFDSIKLICVDEIHTLGDSRGSTLEACLSRVKIRASCRFILVSATIPNADDIATWIGGRNGNRKATLLMFGEEYRPCKLDRLVLGYPRTGNGFQFDRTLDSRLFGVLKEHGRGKPTLIFCATRKGTLMAAERLAKDFKDAVKGNFASPWPLPKTQDWSFDQQSLRDLFTVGIGVHHAGLSMEDRRCVEEAFLSGQLSVVVATSTLAVGVNLPCSNVIIKGIEMWDGVQMREYTSMDIVQMMGRAGRPNFDPNGLAIILCDTKQKVKLSQIDQGGSTLESSLHFCLPEHVNSEIVLGAITDVETAHLWLRSTYMAQRMKVNPRHYGIVDVKSENWESRCAELMEDALQTLEKCQLVAKNANGHLEATTFGRIAAKSYVRQATMSLMINLSDNATKKDILDVLSRAEEFKDVRLRPGERAAYNALKGHPDIRFALSKVDQPHDKVFLLFQAILGGISLNSFEYKNPDSVLALEAIGVYKHATRLIRCIVEAAIARRASGLLLHALELNRCLNAKAWEDRPIVFRQLESIGGKSIKVLASKRITTFEKLRQVEPYQLESWLNRKPPFGHNLLRSLRSFPICNLDITEVESKDSSNHHMHVKVTLRISTSVDPSVLPSQGSKSSNYALGMASIVTRTSDMKFIDYRRISLKSLIQAPKAFQISAELTKPSETIQVTFSPDDYAGLSTTRSYKPNTSSPSHPIPKSHHIQDMPIVLSDSDDEDIVINNPLLATTKTSKSVMSTLNTEQPMRLTNGNYMCNHACKDKRKCLHTCCKEGLREPPKRRAKEANGSKSEKAGRLNPKKKLAYENHSNLQKAAGKPQSDESSFQRTKRNSPLRGTKSSVLLSSQDTDFSDDDLDAIMAALPSPVLKVDQKGSLKRRNVSPLEEPPEKRFKADDSDDLKKLGVLAGEATYPNEPNGGILGIGNPFQGSDSWDHLKSTKGLNHSWNHLDSEVDLSIDLSLFEDAAAKGETEGTLPVNEDIDSRKGPALFLFDDIIPPKPAEVPSIPTEEQEDLPWYEGIEDDNGFDKFFSSVEIV